MLVTNEVFEWLVNYLVNKNIPEETALELTIVVERMLVIRRAGESTKQNRTATLIRFNEIHRDQLDRYKLTVVSQAVLFILRIDTLTLNMGSLTRYQITRIYSDFLFQAGFSLTSYSSKFISVLIVTCAFQKDASQIAPRQKILNLLQTNQYDVATLTRLRGLLNIMISFGPVIATCK